MPSESWTSERIRKLVLDRTLIELDSLLSGNTRGHVRMEAVDGKIQEAARAVYRRIFEVSELLAANRAANQFIQRLYQATSGRVDPKTLEVADTLVRRGSSPTLANYSLLLSRDDQGYTLQLSGAAHRLRLPFGARASDSAKTSRLRHKAGRPRPRRLK